MMMKDDQVKPGSPTAAFAAVRRPGRPRSGQAEEAILDAVFALFSEGATYDGLSMEMIAAEAKVGKATIYRRWPNKEALIIDAICRRLHPEREKATPPGVSVREDLVYLLEVMRRHLQEESSGAAYNVLANASKANPTLHRRYHEVVIEPRRDVYRQVLRRGVATGELRPDLDIERAMLMLTAPMLTATRHSPPPEPVGRRFSVGLVDDLLRGAALEPGRICGEEPPDAGHGAGSGNFAPA
ncbi:TetR/AcrR family transcriptional regulator [Actinocrinis puniceicyclus]|uniref:TetR/AcrR family transcriptional regulator n=1 Tax=Actinocrinis puniceicyclus TaxID=977794 RepID=A0A8J7WLI0_9ACTN|nr:TetR/AcrR family transcriptional regulator [Actinocrinis puniceicyclus]MBS2964573.1 TetR/AcrR family transcriptional regulator [Actinocrinis puniceicyclus]